MTCCLCSGVALWRVLSQGYCRNHKAEAYAAEKKSQKAQHAAADLRRITGEPDHVWGFEKRNGR